MHKCINKSIGNVYHLEQMVDNFFPYSQQQLEFDKPVQIVFQSDKTNAMKLLGKTAYYNPASHEVYLYVDGRHPKDILRSLSHELVHHSQNCRGEFKEDTGTELGYAQNDPHMRKMEREAYTKGNLIFRDFEDLIKRGKIIIDINFKNSGEPQMSLKEWKNKELNTLLLKKWGLLKEADTTEYNTRKEDDELEENGNGRNYPTPVLRKEDDDEFVREGGMMLTGKLGGDRKEDDDELALELSQSVPDPGPLGGRKEDDDELDEIRASDWGGERKEDDEEIDESLQNGEVPTGPGKERKEDDEEKDDLPEGQQEFKQYITNRVIEKLNELSSIPGWMEGRDEDEEGNRPSYAKKMDLDEECPGAEGGEAIDISAPGMEVHVDDISELAPEEAFGAGIAAARQAIDDLVGSDVEEIEEIEELQGIGDDSQFDKADPDSGRKEDDDELDEIFSRWKDVVGFDPKHPEEDFAQDDDDPTGRPTRRRSNPLKAMKPEDFEAGRRRKDRKDELEEGDPLMKQFPKGHRMTGTSSRERLDYEKDPAAYMHADQAEKLGLSPEETRDATDWDQAPAPKRAAQKKWRQAFADQFAAAKGKARKRSAAGKVRSKMKRDPVRAGTRSMGTMTEKQMISIDEAAQLTRRVLERYIKEGK